MTREEAIRYLIRPVATSTEIGEEKQKEFEAYNMAIESLQKDIERHEMVIRASERHLGIVRCKDCQHWYEKMNKCNRCPSISGNWEASDFCSYGKRREE